ncbi:hypothetical protein C1Y41_04465 [Pantoea sp. ICBG 1758]|nr:hypothetical protein C1Y41_04465 [Pantoea sp. ICBG 1758]
MKSDENDWPLEFKNGEPVGRSLPEPQTTNFQENCRAVETSANVIVSTGSSLNVDATGAPDGGGICLVPAISEYYLVSQDVNGIDLQPGTAYSLTADWTRLVFARNVSTQSRTRIWLGRDLDNSSGIPFVFLTQTNAMNNGNYVFSWFARVADASNFHAGIGQIENSNYPYSTSPIINESDVQGERAASSVTIANQGNSQGLALIYDDRMISVIPFSGEASISLPFATWNWSERYLTRIKFLSNIPDLSPIDMTAETLDSRVTYTGPAHTYLDQAGNLATSAENEWPLEYVNGQVMGRHEPEPSTTNYAIDSAITDLAQVGTNASWMFPQGTTITVSDSEGSQFPIINSESLKVFVGVYNETKGAFLVPDTNPNTGSDWSRVILPFTNDMASELRFYTQRETTTSYLYEKCPAVPTGSFVASVYRKLTSENMQATAPQIEPGTVPTSPIFNGETEQNTRKAAKAIVTNPGLATQIQIDYSDNSRAIVSFTNNQAVIPFSSLAWSSRYITTIRFLY